MPDVILIRPGATEFDEQSRIQGTLDLPLSERGRQQVAELVQQLGESPPEIIFSAPSEPARTTAETLGAELDVPVKPLDGLRNLDQGLWQGMQVDEICRKYPKLSKQWRDSPESICPPGGEDVAAALQRARAALAKPLRRKETIAVVSSEPLATLLRCIMLGQKPEVPGPMCGGGQPQLAETLHVNGDSGKRTAPEAAADEPPQAESGPRTNGKRSAV
jgi:probable phosphoglycerate mutase